MLRAVLDSVAFSQKQLVDAFLSETDYAFERLVVDGGVAQNDFILRLIADLTGGRSSLLIKNDPAWLHIMSGLPVVRPDSVEMSVWGVASLAGLGAGVWSSVEEVIINDNNNDII